MQRRGGRPVAEIESGARRILRRGVDHRRDEHVIAPDDRRAPAETGNRHLSRDVLCGAPRVGQRRVVGGDTSRWAAEAGPFLSRQKSRERDDDEQSSHSDRIRRSNFLVPRFAAQAPLCLVSALRERPPEQFGDANRRRLALKVRKVKPSSLYSDDADDVSPLAVGDATSELEPAKLLQEDVFGWVNRQFNAVAKTDPQTPRQLFGVEWGSARHEDIDLQHRRVVDHVDIRTCSDRAAYGVFIDLRKGT